jgi:hypothetical protein
MIHRDISASLTASRVLFALFGVLLLFSAIDARSQDVFIHTKEGRPIMNRKHLLAGCIEGLHKEPDDPLAISICSCQLDNLERHFTYKEYKKHMTYGVIDLSAMTKEDSTFEKRMNACYTSTGKTVLLQAEGFEEQFMANCRQDIQKSSGKKLDMNRVNNFCSCQLEIIKARKLTDAQIQTLNNPNSLLFYDVVSKCGDPFGQQDSLERDWSESAAGDIRGPAADTLPLLMLVGMTYVKVTLGDETQVWLFDTGSSDLLINTETEEALKKENILTPSNYLGIGEYEMANGVIDTCRKYRVNDVRIGHFTLDNIVVAVTDKGKKIIVGKSLLNKFTSWMLDNKEQTLVLRK